jgi:Domain of unknown function (DUF4263)
MKEFDSVTFDPPRCRAELDRLQSLLASKTDLSERGDLQPLFKECPQLAAFIGATIPGIGPATRLAYEFDVFGDYTADLVIGNPEKKTFCAIELEDARPDSIFHQIGSRATKEWGRRLEHGFGQLVDWFFSFDDYKRSAGFTKHFGYGHIEFFGMLLIGRSGHLTENDRTRLRWRADRVTVNTHKVFCLTYDELSQALNTQWQFISSVSGQSQNPPK